VRVARLLVALFTTVQELKRVWGFKSKEFYYRKKELAILVLSGLYLY